MRKLVLEQPNALEVFSTRAMAVKKLVILLSFSYHNFEDTLINCEKDMFRKESLTYSSEAPKKCEYT